MKTKLTLTSLFLILFFNFGKAQSYWEFANNFSDSIEPIATTIDGLGDILVTGRFTGNSSVFGPYTLTDSGGGDFFVAKFNSLGQIQWARAYGDAGNEMVFAIATDGNNEIYIGAGTNSVGLTFAASVLNSGGFLLKLDINGNPIWAYNFGINVTSIVTLGNNIYFTGYFFGSATIGTYFFPGAGNTDAFIAQIDNMGNFQWAQSAGGPGDDNATDLAVDPWGNLFITGGFGGFGGNTISIGSTTLTSNGGSDFYIAKFSYSGNFMWAMNYGGTGAEQIMCLASDTSGNVIASGLYNGTTQLGSNTYNSLGSDDIFLMKTDSSGNFQWARNISGAGNDRISDITTDLAGNIYGAGYYYSSVLTIGSSTFNNQGAVDIFLAKWNKNGFYQWETSIGNSGTEITSGMASTPSGDIYITGWFRSPTLTFGSFPMNYSGGGVNMFLSKYSICAPIDTSVTFSGGTLHAVLSGASYQWVDCNVGGGTDIPGATSQNFSPSVSGDYAVGITQGYCGMYSDCHHVELIGMSEISSGDDLQIYPNPTKESIRLSFERSITGIEIFNLMGEKVKHCEMDFQKFSGNNVDISLSEFNSGLYLLMIHTLDSTFYKRFIKL